MSSDEYTPTREEVLLAVETQTLDESALPEGAFDRYEAARDAEQQRIGAVKALREAAERVELYRVTSITAEGLAISALMEGATEEASAWLGAEADRIEQEGKTDDR